MVRGEINMKIIKGAFPVLITPMDEFQEINWNGVKQNVNYFIEQKSGWHYYKRKHRRVC